MTLKYSNFRLSYLVESTVVRQNCKIAKDTVNIVAKCPILGQPNPGATQHNVGYGVWTTLTRASVRRTLLGSRFLHCTMQTTVTVTSLSFPSTPTVGLSYSRSRRKRQGRCTVAAWCTDSLDCRHTLVSWPMTLEARPMRLNISGVERPTAWADVTAQVCKAVSNVNGVSLVDYSMWCRSIASVLETSLGPRRMQTHRLHRSASSLASCS